MVMYITLLPSIKWKTKENEFAWRKMIIGIQLMGIRIIRFSHFALLEAFFIPLDGDCDAATSLWWCQSSVVAGERRGGVVVHCHESNENAKNFLSSQIAMTCMLFCFPHGESWGMRGCWI